MASSHRNVAISGQRPGGGRPPLAVWWRTSLAAFLPGAQRARRSARPDVPYRPAMDTSVSSAGALLDYVFTFG